MKIPFKHILNPDKFLPFLGSAVIDVDNDDTEELFIGGGQNQEDKFFHYEKGALTDEQEFNKKWIMFENKGDFNSNAS